MSRRPVTFMDQLNHTPLAFGILGAYLLLAVATNPLDSGTEEFHEKIMQWGAANGLLVMDGEPWRLIIHTFLHGNLIHLLMNGYGLYLLGPMLESQLGTVRFGILYAVAGIMGGIVALTMQVPVIPLLGGSGSLFGMMGAIVAINLRGSRTLMEGFRSYGTRIVFLLLGINLVMGLLISNISNEAHAGGLLSGFVVTFCFLFRGRARTDKVSRVIQVGWIAVFLSMIFYACFPVLRWDYQAKQACIGSPAFAKQLIKINIGKRTAQSVLDNPYIDERTKDAIRGWLGK